MESEPSLVGADCAVHLNAEASIDLELPLVVDPRDPEHDDALGLDNPLQHFRASVLRVLVEDDVEGFRHLFDRLVEFGLCGVLGFYLGHQGLNVFTHPRRTS